MLRRATADDGADRLIDAPGAAGDAPVRASADPVAGLVDALREPARPHELDGTDDLVARLAATVRGGGAVAQATPIGRRPVLAKVLTGKVAALAVVALCSAGAAAATGHLPDPVQRRLSDTLSHVGVDLPSPDDAPTATDPDRLDPPTSTPAPGSTAPGSVATGSAATGSVATGSSAPPDPKAESVASGASTADADGPGAAAGGVGAAVPTFGARPAPSSAAPTVTTGSAHPSAPGHGGSNPSTAPGHSGQAGDDHDDDPPGGESSHRAHDRTSTRGATPSAVTTTTTTTSTARRRRAGDDAEPAVPSATTAHGRP